MRAKLYKATGGFGYICIMAWIIAFSGCMIENGVPIIVPGWNIGVAIWFLSYIPEQLSMVEHLNFTLRLDLEDERKKK